jgi:CBS domain-containing protein
MPATETYKRLTVGSVMHMGIIECGPQTPLEDLARLIAEEDTHSVAVHGLPAGEPGEEQRGWGLVSDVDLMRALAANGLNSEASRAATGEIVTIGLHESLEHAAQLMGEHECSHLVVTATDTQLPIGVISSLDVIRGLVWGWRPTAHSVD